MLDGALTLLEKQLSRPPLYVVPIQMVTHDVLDVGVAGIPKQPKEFPDQQPRPTLLNCERVMVLSSM